MLSWTGSHLGFLSDGSRVLAGPTRAKRSQTQLCLALRGPNGLRPGMSPGVSLTRYPVRGSSRNSREDRGKPRDLSVQSLSGGWKHCAWGGRFGCRPWDGRRAPSAAQGHTAAPHAQKHTGHSDTRQLTAQTSHPVQTTQHVAQPHAGSLPTHSAPPTTSLFPPFLHPHPHSHILPPRPSSLPHPAPPSLLLLHPRNNEREAEQGRKYHLANSGGVVGDQRQS